MVKVIIEIPKGSDRRIHFNKSENRFVDLGPIKSIIPINNGIMPADYGFIPLTYMESDNDELDAIVLSNIKHKTGDEIEAKPIALLRRADKDDKVLCIEGNYQPNSWESLEGKLKDLLKSYFGYKSEIYLIEDANSSEEYIQKVSIY